MAQRTDRLLAEIEAGALDSGTPIADTLRKVIALGGRYGSPELRDWASQELNGYDTDTDVPDYRQIQAPLYVNAAMPFGGYVKGEQISPMQLPEFARERIAKGIELRHGIGEIEALGRRTEQLELQSTAMADIAAFMNAEGKNNGAITKMYWSVHPTVIAGVVDRVRTALTSLVAELIANIPPGAETPPPEEAANAVQFVVTGKRHRINFVAPQGGSTVTTEAAAAGDEPSWWTAWKIAGAVIGGLVAIGGALFGLMQVQNWSF